MSGTALLINDTRAWYHYGCACTSIALHEEFRSRFDAVMSLPTHRWMGMTTLPASIDAYDDDRLFDRFCSSNPDVVERIGASDGVFINGEGTLHGVGGPAVALLYLAYISAVRFQRPVSIVNHSCFPADSVELPAGPARDLYTKVYSELDRIAVRERFSYEIVRQMGLEAVQAFDCLPLFVERHFLSDGGSESRRRVVIAGSVAWGSSGVGVEIGKVAARLSQEGYEPVVLVGADAAIASDDVSFLETLSRHIGDSMAMVVATSEWEWLRIIDEAALLISGRFHHSIAAAVLDTPFIVMESNTPKIHGMLDMLGCGDFLSIKGPDLCERLFDLAARKLSSPHEGLLSEAGKQNMRSLAAANFT